MKINFPRLKIAFSFDPLYMILPLVTIFLTIIGITVIAQRLFFFEAAYLCAIITLLQYIFYKRREYKEIIEKSSKGTFLEIEQTRTKLLSLNEHLHAINQLSTQLSTVKSKNEVYFTVTEALVKSFYYDCVGFWTIESDDGEIQCIRTTKMEENTNTKLEQDNDFKKYVRDLFDLAVKRKETISINNGCTPESDIGINIEKFFNLFNFSSFMVSPVFHENIPLGFITVAFHKGRKINWNNSEIFEFASSASYIHQTHHTIKLLDEKDKILVDSISSIVGDALVKIELFSDMESKIDERADELKRTHEELARAREMIIQSEKLSSLGRMAAGIIHQINNALNFLINILPDLKSDFEGLRKAYQYTNVGILDPKVKCEILKIAEENELDDHLKDMDFIFSSTEKAIGKTTTIANSLKVFTNSASDDQLVNTDLFSLIQNAVDLIPLKLRKEVDIRLHEDNRPSWKINPNRMEQVFVNLINNAIDAMNGKGTIDISGMETDSNEVEIRVKDCGPGIPPEIQNRIFDPFFTTKPAGKSTGLGLSISAEIVHQFGGRLSVESKPGEGAEFIIKFSQAHIGPEIKK